MLKDNWKICAILLAAATLYFSHNIVWSIAWNKAKAEPCTKAQCLQVLIDYEETAYNRLLQRLKIKR